MADQAHARKSATWRGRVLTLPAKSGQSPFAPKAAVESGIVRNIQSTVPHFVAVGYILRDTDMIATVPKRFAKCMAGPF